MAAPGRAQVRNKYGISQKYIRLSREMDHTAIGTKEAIEADARSMYETMREYRDRANATIEGDD